MKKKRRALRICLLLCFLCLLMLSSCAEEPSAGDVLEELCDLTPSLPFGRHYRPDVSPEDPSYPSEELLAVAFGDGSLPSVLSEIRDSAFYFSLHDACELSLFYCERAGTARDVERLCLERLDRLRHYWNADPTAAALLDGAAVLRHGHWVLLAITPTPKETARAFFRIT